MNKSSGRTININEAKINSLAYFLPSDDMFDIIRVKIEFTISILINTREEKLK